MDGYLLYEAEEVLDGGIYHFEPKNGEPFHFSLYKDAFYIMRSHQIPFAYICDDIDGRVIEFVRWEAVENE